MNRTITTLAFTAILLASSASAALVNFSINDFNSGGTLTGSFDVPNLALGIDDYSQSVTVTVDGVGSFLATYVGSSDSGYMDWAGDFFQGDLYFFSTELYAVRESSWSSLDGQSYSLIHSTILEMDDVYFENSAETSTISGSIGDTSQISFTVVPEPSASAIAAGCGALALAGLFRRRRRA